MADINNLRSITDLETLLNEVEGNDLQSLLDQVDAADLQRLAEEISTPGELRQLLELGGGSDKLINSFIAKADADTMLDRLFSLMGTRFVADKLGNDSGVVQWQIDTADGQKIYHLVIADGRAEGGRGPADKPRTTLTMGAPDLLRLCAGTLDGITAFMNSKIKIAGDMMFGAKLPAVFDIS